jgi:hypothetical protein
MADLWPFIQGGTNYTMKFDYDSDGSQIYVGWAQPGSASSATAWRIMKQVFSNGQVTDIQWPTASTAFSFVWDSRASYSYS